jgi:drug/metabolite transporter (DMT)-like permease
VGAVPSLPEYGHAIGDRSTERQGIVLAVLAVILFSTSAVLVRYAAESLSAFEIAAGRALTAGALVLLLALLSRQGLPGWTDWPRFLIFGLVAALHFGLYIAALGYTTIAHTLALVYTAPIFVAVFSRLFLGERLRPRQWLGTVIAVVGVAILTGFEPLTTPAMIFGDLLALGSAVCYGLYSVAGRSQRDRYPLFTYAGAVYLVAALWMVPLAAVTHTPGSWTGIALLSVLALGLLPLGLGHTLYNAALRRTSATKVNLIATQEVTGGVLLGILLLGEIPSPTSLVGAAVTLFGIILVVL